MGYLVSSRGIKVVTGKITALINMRSLRCIKEVQQSNRHIATLSLFFSSAHKMSMPLSIVKCKVKKYLSIRQRILQKSTLLINLMVGEGMYLYLKFTKKAVTVILMVDRDGRQQPTYLVNHSLTGVQQRNLYINKMEFTIRMVSTKLRHYFRAHMIVVLTSHPLKNLGKREQ